MVLLVLIGVSAIAVFVVVSQSLKLGRSAAFERTLASTPLLDRSTAVGTLVKTRGRLKHPRGTTPYGRQPAGYWQVDVRARFQSKARKPSKGTVTHTPVLDRRAQDDQPLLLEGPDGLTLQLCFADLPRVVRNLEDFSETTDTVPAGLESKDRAKFTNYSVREQFFPPDAELFVYGTLADTNAACATLSDPDSGELSAMVSGATEEEERSKRRATNAVCWRWMILWVVFAGFSWMLYAHG